jgi:tripartite-type tricarboxylate transporter receptor subunit TctC
MASVRIGGAVCALLAAFGLGAGDASAQSPANYYAGRTITLIVGSSPGGYYDVASRVVARHLDKYIPGNPTIVVQNQPGAGGLAGVNRLGNALERDGRTMLVMSRALPQLALLGDPNAAFDPMQLTWLGSLLV